MTRFKRGLVWFGWSSLILLILGAVTYFIPLSPDEALVKKLMERSSRTGVGILVDYDYPVHMKRLWVIATKEGVKKDGKTYSKGQTILNTHISHSFRSGLLFATRFANVKDSNLSSWGFFRTAASAHKSTNFGFPALKVSGLDGRRNNKAERRSIIFHKSYSPWSVGCFMAPPSMNKKIIDLTKGGSIMYVHKSDPEDVKNPTLYPDPPAKRKKKK